MKTSLGVLVTSLRLAAARQLAMQDPVPQQVLEPRLVEPHLLHRALGPLRAELHPHVAQVDLVRAVDLRVAVEHHPQQRRARAQRAHDEPGRADQPVAAADLPRARASGRAAGRARRSSSPVACASARLTDRFQLTRSDSIVHARCTTSTSSESLHGALAPAGYLEIGLRHGDSLALAECPALGVDPAFDLQVELGDNVTLLQESSDELFMRAQPDGGAGRQPRRPRVHRRHAPVGVRAARLHRRRAARALDQRRGVRRHPAARGRRGGARPPHPRVDGRRLQDPRRAGPPPPRPDLPARRHRADRPAARARARSRAAAC